MITEQDLIPGTVFKGFENAHSGRRANELMVLASINTNDSVLNDARLFRFIFLERKTGYGFGGDHRLGMVNLTIEECLSEFGALVRVGTLEEAFNAMGW